MKSFCWTLFLFICASLIISIVIFVSLHNEKSSDKILNNEELFELSIIHINDFHSRFEETNELSLQCQEYEKCIGGFARMKNVIDQLKANRKNAILLNAGDNFQGTSWYSLFRYNVTSHMLNFIDADATTIGTHDFTHGVNGLVPFLKILNSPVVVCNIDDRHEPSIQNLYQKSVIVTRNGRKIGIIGVILQETRDIANTDNINFKNEADSIRDESTNLRQKGVNIIVVLSHCGLERDRQIALETGDFVDIIVGGHSHHFLYTTFDKSSPGPDIPIGPYPIVVTPKSGNNRKVLIVQASAFTKYVGDLKVYFNSLGHVKYYEGNPIFLSSNVERDPDILHELIPWREEINRLSQRVVGYSKVNLMNIGCRRSECVLGSFLADAFVYETQLVYPELFAYSCIIHAGGIQFSLPKGNISYGDILELMPFENTLDILKLQGDVIIDIFEHSVSSSFDEIEFIGIHMLQISGFQLTFNTSKPVGRRLETIQIKNKYNEFENINLYKSYVVIAPSFVARGGDGYTMIKTNRKHYKVGLLDIDLIEKYILNKSPISPELDHRIIMLK